MDDGGVVLVTGVADGFGRSVALGFGRAGFDVVCADSDVAQASRVAADIEDGGGRAIPIQIDVTTAMDVRAAFDKVDDLFGRVDVVVHVAPRSRTVDVGTPTEGDLRASLVDPLTSSVFVVRRAQIAMDGAGSIVIVAPPESADEPLSAMTAGALERFVQATARRSVAVRVNVVRPSRPASDAKHDRDLVHWVLFLGGPTAGGVTGATIAVDLPPPPRVTEALLPEIRAALEDDARQAEWDAMDDDA